MSWIWQCTIMVGMGAGALWGLDWPQWRGPQATGHVPKGIAVPQQLPADPKVVWRVKVGEGMASPVVSDGKVFHMDNQQGKETVHALEAATGRELWSVALDEAFQDTQTPPGPRCTPLVDGDRIYAQSCRGEFRCLSTADGRERWRIHFVKDFQAEFIGEMGTAQGAARHGYNGGPALEGDRIVVGVGGTNGASVVCFEKKTGRVVWRSQNDVPGYAPPVLAGIEGVRQVISFTAEGVMGLDLADGRLLWRVSIDTAYGRHVITPVVYGNRVVVSSHEAGLIGIQVEKKNGDLEAKTAWVSKESAINFASPVAVGKHLYGVGPDRKLVCVDMETGRQTWVEEGLFSTAGWRTYAAFLAMERNILMLTDTGLLVLFEADPSAYREISRAQVCGQTWCNPAYADGHLYVRDARQLLCVSIIR